MGYSGLKVQLWQMVTLESGSDVVLEVCLYQQTSNVRLFQVQVEFWQTLTLESGSDVVLEVCLYQKRLQCRAIPGYRWNSGKQ